MGTGAGPIFGTNDFAMPQQAPNMGGGSNQWMSYPAMPSVSQTPGGAPTGVSTPSMQVPGSTNPFAGAPTANSAVPGGKLPGGNWIAPTMDPTFTNQFYQMLTQMMGGGGNNLQQSLLSFLNGGQTSIPGANQLNQMGQTGDPISALPEWQQMLAAQQQNIQQNQANLKEQFAFAGDLQSSPFGTAMSNYEQQTTKDQNALLAQLQQQALESAEQRKLTADTSLTGMAGAESQFLDSLFSGAGTASPTFLHGASSSVLGGIGSLISGLGQGFGGIASGIQDLSNR